MSPTFQKRIEITEIPEEDSDRILPETSSLNMSLLAKEDVEIILNIMPNKRYRDLIHFRYIKEKSNEETARLLGMSMDNYYNKHKLAKEQFSKILRKEGLI